MLEVVEAGPGTTIQDLGRPDAAAMGVPPGGACDPWSLGVSNILLNNDVGAAALEVTFGGLEVRATESLVVGLAGADLGATVVEDGRPLRMGVSHLIWAGTTIAFRGRPSTARLGARAYLAVPGGFDVRPVLGSAATCLVGGFGGLDGRAVQAGDMLRATGRLDHVAAGRAWAGDIPALDLAGGASLVRLVVGPHAGWFPPDALSLLTGEAWTVRPESDRVGLRLDGPALPRRSGDIVSGPVTWGAIQVPPDGTPIVLLADHQTVGGYPVVATVARADRPLIGQLAPGDPVRFTMVDVAAAQAGYRDAIARQVEGRRQLAADETWHDLWRSADG